MLKTVPCVMWPQKPDEQCSWLLELRSWLIWRRLVCRRSSDVFALDKASVIRFWQSSTQSFSLQSYIYTSFTIIRVFYTREVRRRFFHWYYFSSQQRETKGFEFWIFLGRVCIFIGRNSSPDHCIGSYASNLFTSFSRFLQEFEDGLLFGTISSIVSFLRIKKRQI